MIKRNGVEKLIIASSYMAQAGILIILLCVLIAASSYVGRQNEAYSFLNHFISELGEIGVSPLALIFNGGLILGGLLTSCFMLGMAIHIGGRWGLGLGIVGLVTSITVTLVGIYPMNQLEIHMVTANTFFRGGLLVSLGYSLYILCSRQPQLPKVTAITSGITVLAFALFLWFLPGSQEGSESVVEILKNRPEIWALPILEWFVFLCVMGWIASTAYFLRKTIKNNQKQSQLN
ncbi:MAG TPA: DUF998 domain-containing protein [Gammaproteobacteria bacterium]|jgi:hypothetical membrane protein|nr:DUF998 domain-containing protein [Gammaproteobacteria bacterium]